MLRDPLPARVESAGVVIIPTYNEIDNLPGIVTKVLSSRPDVDVLVVDDGSPDGTGHLADRLASAEPRLHVMHRSEKKGLGAAYLAGFDWALLRNYRVIIEMDADGSHDPCYLSDLFAAIGAGADVAIGSRYVDGGRVVNWPFRRRLISRVANRYATWMLGAEVNDITAGYRAYRKEVLLAIDLGSVTSNGFCFQIELAWRAQALGLTIAECPITFVDRERGTSKMRLADVFEAVTMVASWGVRNRSAPLSRGFGKRWSSGTGTSTGYPAMNVQK